MIQLGQRLISLPRSIVKSNLFSNRITKMSAFERVISNNNNAENLLASLKSEVRINFAKTLK